MKNAAKISARIALLEIALADEPALAWAQGPRERITRATAGEISDAVERLLASPSNSSPSGSTPDWVLIWDLSLGVPSLESLAELAAGDAGSGDVWHAGLLLGQGGRPRLFETVHPTWMLACDPPPEQDATSWRLSLRACLFRPRVWRLGGPDVGYSSLAGTALELGHRWFWGGAVLRHAPRLLGGDPGGHAGDPAPSLDDEMRFLFQRTGRFWATWALGRGLLSRRISPSAIACWWRGRGVTKSAVAHLPPATSSGEDQGPEAVTVLIPTLDRYPYLRVVLEQLTRQSVPPAQVIVIDQTAAARRQRDWHDQPDLPLLVIERDEPGQSSARNAGLLQATGEVILFLDDDVEMDEQLIARHLHVLHSTGADASCGVTEEIGAGPLPAEFRHPRVADVFPTCNAALRRSALRGSGLFDLAFDFGSRADADLGQRLYLSGALLWLSPSVSVLHHKAPAGGLREHKARVATYAASRRSLTRHLPSVTEIYLARRYGSPASTREMLWQRAFGTLRTRGSAVHQLRKLVWGLVLLPDTLARIASRARKALSMLRKYPEIPHLPTSGGES